MPLSVQSPSPSSIPGAPWRRLRQWLDNSLAYRHPRPVVLEMTLFRRLCRLAEREGRSTAAVTGDLLRQALDRYRPFKESELRWMLLTPREQQVAALLCLGYRTPAIASLLNISPETVKSHVHHVLEKFDLHTRLDLRRSLAGWDFTGWDEIEDG